MAASTATTESMIPSAMLRNAGLGTSSTVDSDTRTVRPLNATALPAVAIVSATAAVEACRAFSAGRRLSSAARNRTTMNSA